MNKLTNFYQQTKKATNSPKADAKGHKNPKKAGK